MFIITLEILLRNIREDEDIKGIIIGKKKFKTKAFADDIIITTEDPVNCIPRALDRIKEYGKVVGLKINYEKTKMLVRNLETNEKIELQEKSGLKITKRIKYLGIQTTVKGIDLIQENYVEIWKKIKKNLESWKRLNLSLMGRISLVKMNVVSKMVYLFQNLPILGTNKIFKDWKRDITKFIWDGKKPRVKYKILIDHRERGGYGLPGNPCF